MDRKIDKDSPTRICNKCGVYKPWSEFNLKSTGPNGRGSRCRKCAQREFNTTRDADPVAWKEKVRLQRLKFKYGISLEEFNLRVKQQNNLCSICREPMRSPHVDHNHKTGKNRDLLCLLCNVGLGAFKDDPARLEAASNYLHRHEETLE